MQSKPKTNKQVNTVSTLTKLKQHSNHRISIIIITVITLRQQSGEVDFFTIVRVYTTSHNNQISIPLPLASRCCEA